MTTILQRIDNITHMRPEYYTPTPPPPKSVKIELTGRCNFRCSFCATGQNLRDKRDMPRDSYSKIIRKLKSAGVEELGLFFLGESFLVSWLPEAIAEAKEVGFDYVFLTSNASVASPEMVRKCMDAGLDSLKWSLNYSDPQQFAEYANVGPKIFGKMIQNIKDAHHIRRMFGYNTMLSASYIKYDDEQPKRMAPLLDELGAFIDHIYELPLYNQICRASKKGGWRFTGGNMGRSGALVDPLPCWTLFTEGHITYDGKLTGCCFDHAYDFDMGDLNVLEFMDAWHSDKFKELRYKHLEKDVRGSACDKCVKIVM